MRTCFTIYKVISQSQTVITLALLSKSCLFVIYFNLQNLWFLYYQYIVKILYLIIVFFKRNNYSFTHFKYFFPFDVLFEIVFTRTFEHIRVLSELMVINGLDADFLCVFLQVGLLGSLHNTIWTWIKHVKVEIFINQFKYVTCLFSFPVF